MRQLRLAAPAVALALCLSALGGPTVAADPSTALPPFVDVPEYRADNHRTGNFVGPGPVAQPVMVWSRTVNGGINFTPQIADGMILFGAGDANLYALDARTGAENWRFKAGGSIVRYGSAGDDTYVFSSGDGILHALDLATGHELWSRPGVGVGSDIEDGVVYVPGSDNHAYGLDLATGKELWSWAAPANVFYLSVADGTAYASVEDGRFYAISVADGTELWHLQTVGTSQGIPVIGDERVFVSTAEDSTEAALACHCGELYAIDGASGATQWTFSALSGVPLTPGALADGVYYLGTQGDGLYAFPAAGDGSGATPMPIWHTQIDGWSYRNQAVSGDTLYVPLWDPDSLMALDASNGTVRWNLPLAGHPGGTLVSGGMVFVADDSGVISAYAEPALKDAIGATTSGPLFTVAVTEQPPNPFTVIGTLEPSTTTLRTMLAFDIGPDGLIYALDMKPSVTVIDPATGNVVRTWGHQGTGQGEFDLTRNDGNPGMGDIDVGLDGTVYVADGANHRLQVFTPLGTFMRQMGSFGTGDGQFSRPMGITVDDQGSVYAVDEDRPLLTKFDRDGAFVWSKPGKEYQRVAHLPDGHIVWLEGGGVLTLDPATGADVDRWGEPGLGFGEVGNACDISVDGAGNEYILHCAPNRTQVFDPQHRLIGGAYTPQDKSFVPVFGPHGEVYATDWYDSDNIYILKDSLLTP